MTNKLGTKILILQQRNWSPRIGQPLAKRFHADGFRLGAVTFKRDIDRQIRSQTDVPYVFVLSHDDVQEDIGPSLGPDLPTLDEVCEGLSVDTIWTLVQSLRSHVRSYGEKYYYGFKQNVPDAVIVAYVQRAYQACLRVFDDFNPDVIIGPNFVSMFHAMLNLMADGRGVPMIGVTDSKVRRMLVFSHSYLDDKGPFIDRVDALNAGAVSANESRANEYVADNRDRLKGQGYPQPAGRMPLRRSLRLLARHLRVSFRNENKPELLPDVMDSRSPKIVLRDFVAHRANQTAVERFPYVDLASVGAYAYFPLQFQPEATIDLQAARFNNQLETARQVAMSMPGDLTLVVKDHPAMFGLRPRSYLEKLARTPNVKLVDFRTPPETVLRGAKLVIASVSTTLMEAAMMGLPSVQLSDLGTTLKLPNVLHHPDLTTLPTAVIEALRMDCGSEEYHCRLRNYIAAAMDVGFDGAYMETWLGRSDGKADLDGLYRVFKADVEDALRVPTGTPLRDSSSG